MEIYSKLRMPQTHKINEMAALDHSLLGRLATTRKDKRSQMGDRRAERTDYIKKLYSLRYQKHHSDCIVGWKILKLYSWLRSFDFF